MLANYFTLKSIVQEVDRALRSSTLEHAYCFRRDELRLHFSNAQTLIVLLTPVQGALYLSNNIERLPKKNVVSFFSELNGQPFIAASISATDREVTLSIDSFELRLTFFGTPNACLFTGGKLISSFRKERGERESPADTRAISTLDLLGKRLRIEYDAAEKDGESVIFLERLTSNSGAWVHEIRGRLLLSPIELKLGVSDAPQHFESPSEAVRIVLTERHHAGKFKDASQELVPKLKQAFARTERVLAEIKRAETHTSRAEDSIEIGKEILANLHAIARSTSSVTLSVIGEEREIKLDPKLSASENAERYFDRAHRAKDAQLELAERRDSLEKERATLEHLIERATNTVDTSEIEKLEGEFSRLFGKSVLGDTRAEASDNSDPLSRFRQFTVAGGLRLLIGKNAAQNDDLTLHVAKKDDIWLHARGVKGSHGVLQKKNRDKPVPKEAIEEAAAITAYFSDAKTQSLAPVSFTEKKFVRKPRGAAVGAVKLEREQVVMVRPGLPEDKKQK